MTKRNYDEANDEHYELKRLNGEKKKRFGYEENFETLT